MSMKALALYKKRLLKKINAIEVIEHREEEVESFWNVLRGSHA